MRRVAFRVTTQNHQLDLFAASNGPEGPSSAHLRIATWNVNGVRAREKQVADWIASAEAPDVICLQELKAEATQVPASLCALEGYHCYWHGGKGYSGVGLLVRTSAFREAPVFTHPDFDFEHRIVTATADGLTVASIYVPNGGKDFEAKMRFLEALDGWVAAERAAGRSIILCGDINVTRADIDVHPKERAGNKPVIGQLPEERALFQRILSRGLVDVARHLRPDDDAMFTWWPPWRQMRQRNIGWRIDYILASDDLLGGLVGCTIRADYGTSDHCPVVAEFAYPSPAS